MPVDVPTEHFFTPSRVPGQRLALLHFIISVFPFLAENNGLLCGKFFSTEFRWSARTMPFNSFRICTEILCVHDCVWWSQSALSLLSVWETCLMYPGSVLRVHPLEHRVLWKHIGPGVVPGPADCQVCSLHWAISLAPKIFKVEKIIPRKKKAQNKKKTQTQNNYKVFNFLILFVYNSDILSGKERNELILTHQLILWSDIDSVRLDSSQGPVSALYTGYEWFPVFLILKTEFASPFAYHTNQIEMLLKNVILLLFHRRDYFCHHEFHSDQKWADWRVDGFCLLVLFCLLCSGLTLALCFGISWWFSGPPELLGSNPCARQASYLLFHV